jgi:biopolymer transport protein ExbD
MSAKQQTWYLGISIVVLMISLVHLGFVLFARAEARAALSGASELEVGDQESADRFNIIITDEGQFFDKQGNELILDGFQDSLERLVRTNPDLRLVIQAEPHTTYKDIEAAMIASAEVGCVDIIFNAEKCGKAREFEIMLPCAGGAGDWMPVEALIQINSDGTVEVDGILFDADDSRLLELEEHLRGLRSLAEAEGAGFVVNLLPSADAVYERLIDVLEACSVVRVRYLTFNQGS